MEDQKASLDRRAAVAWRAAHSAFGSEWTPLHGI